MEASHTESTNNTLPALPWGSLPLTEHTYTGYQLGPLQLAFKLVQDDLWISSSYLEQTAANSSALKSETGWSRWSLNKNPQKIYLSPTFSERAVVIKPEHPFHLTVGAEARIYVRVPVSVAVSLKDKADPPLTEVPTVVLSNTWFGDFLSGQICSWLSSTARREYSFNSYPPHLAICPIVIKNTSQETLGVEKIRLQVDLLSLYKGERSLVSSETRVFFRGSSQISDVQISQGPPREASAAARITGPRNSANRSPRGRTFDKFFDFATLGIFSD